MLFIGSRKIVVLEMWYTVFMCVCVCVRVHMCVLVLHGMGHCGLKNMSWCRHCLMTLSLLSFWPHRQNQSVRRIKWKVPSDKMVCSCWSWIFPSFAWVQKVENMCLPLWWVQRVFPLYASLERARRKDVGKTEGWRAEMCVCVCLCPAPDS